MNPEGLGQRAPIAPAIQQAHATGNATEPPLNQPKYAVTREKCLN